MKFSFYQNIKDTNKTDIDLEHIKDGKVIAFEVESNIGGKLKVEFTEVELENLRQ